MQNRGVRDPHEPVQQAGSMPRAQKDRNSKAMHELPQGVHATEGIRALCGMSEARQEGQLEKSMKKKCNKCGVIKPYSEFYPRFSTTTGDPRGVTNVCRKCRIKQVQERLKERLGP
jgi:hypothetical protein